MNKEIELFKEYFRYENGQIYWIKSSGTRGICGNRAGKLRKDKYYDVGLLGKYYLVHRIIFALNYSYLPDIVDHKDRDSTNNNINNLREATYSKNAHNSGKSKNNTTGVKGIRLTRNGKYEARVGINNTTYQVGPFDDLLTATEAVKNFRLTVHGEFTCNG